MLSKIEERRVHQPDEDDAGAMPVFASPVNRNEQATLRAKKRINVPRMEDNSVSTTQGTDMSAELLSSMKIVEAQSNSQPIEYQEHRSECSIPSALGPPPSSPPNASPEEDPATMKRSPKICFPYPKQERDTLQSLYKKQGKSEESEPTKVGAAWKQGTCNNKPDEQDSASQSTPNFQEPHKGNLGSDLDPQDENNCAPPDLEGGISIDPALQPGASLGGPFHAFQRLANSHSGLVEPEQKEDDVGISDTRQLEEGTAQERQPCNDEEIVLDAVVERCDVNVAASEEGEQERKCGGCGWRTKCLIWGFAWSLVILIAVILFVGIPKTGDKDPSMEDMNEYLLTLLPADTVGAVTLGAAVGSPQAKAFTWLSKDPLFRGGEYSDDRILQRFALATFYFAMGGGNGNSHEWNHHSNWLSPSSHECSWHGLSCNRETKEVAIIDLDDNRMDGSLPSELFWLSNLQMLKLSDNHISGKLPTSILAMNNLIALYLNGNQLESTIPMGLALLTKLETLELQKNDLTGVIPSDLGGLTSLKTINFAGNNLSGTIPSNIGNSKALQMLNLSSNNLAGSIPSSLGGVAELFLNDNMLTGSVPGGLDGDAP